MEVGGLFISAFVVGLTGAMTPGPLLTVTIAESVQRGFRAGPLIVLGHAVLELMLILALLAGLSLYLARASVTRVISIIGGLFLLYMGTMILLDLRSGKLSLKQTDTSAAPGIKLHPVAAGFLISLSNPYWIIWWASIGLTYLSEALKTSFFNVGVFYSGHIMADLGWYSLVSFAISAGRNIIPPLVYKIVLALCGVFLLGLGGYFLRGALNT